MKLLKVILLIFTIIILITVLYLKYVKEEPLIKLFGKSCLIVATGSMEPTIFSEELLIIDEQEKYEKGDIVTYIDEDDFIITHRIIEIDSETFITKGDANNINDNPCNIKNIQGKVIFHSKVLGNFILYWLKPICLIYAIIIVIIEILKSEKERSKVINEA